jgi:hypothetical protein
VERPSKGSEIALGWLTFGPRVDEMSITLGTEQTQTRRSSNSLLKYFQVEEGLDRLERRCLSVEEAPQNRRNFG